MSVTDVAMSAEDLDALEKEVLGSCETETTPSESLNRAAQEPTCMRSLPEKPSNGSLRLKEKSVGHKRPIRELREQTSEKPGKQRRSSVPDVSFASLSDAHHPRFECGKSLDSSNSDMFEQLAKCAVSELSLTKLFSGVEFPVPLRLLVPRTVSKMALLLSLEEGFREGAISSEDELMVCVAVGSQRFLRNCHFSRAYSTAAKFCVHIRYTLMPSAEAFPKIETVGKFPSHIDFDEIFSMAKKQWAQENVPKEKTFTYYETCFQETVPGVTLNVPSVGSCVFSTSEELKHAIDRNMSSSYPSRHLVFMGASNDYASFKPQSVIPDKAKGTSHIEFSSVMLSVGAHEAYITAITSNWKEVEARAMQSGFKVSNDYARNFTSFEPSTVLGVDPLGKKKTLSAGMFSHWTREVKTRFHPGLACVRLRNAEPKESLVRQPRGPHPSFPLAGKRLNGQY